MCILYIGCIRFLIQFVQWVLFKFVLEFEIWMIAMKDIFLVVGFGLEIIKSELTLFLMSCCGTTVYLTQRFCILYKDEEL